MNLFGFLGENAEGTPRLRKQAPVPGGDEVVMPKLPQERGGAGAGRGQPAAGLEELSARSGPVGLPPVTVSAGLLDCSCDSVADPPL